MSKKTQLALETYQRFRKELKSGTLHPIYVFHGEEDYLRENYRKELRKKLVDGPAEDFNYHRFTAEDFSLQAFSDAVNAVPMMSEYTMVELQDINLFSQSTADGKILAEILENLPEYCIILLVYAEIEWEPKQLSQKRWAAVQDKVFPVEFVFQTEAALLPWLNQHLKALQKTMSPELCRYLIFQTGSSMTAMDSEQEKLACYTEQTEITKEDIDAVVTPVPTAALYNLTDAIMRKNFTAVLQTLQTLLRQDEDPIRLNSTIGTQFQQLYTAKLLQERRRSASELCSYFPALRNQAWLANNIYSQAKYFHKNTLKQAIRLCAETDHAMKTSSDKEEQLLQMLVLRLADVCQEGR